MAWSINNAAVNVPDAVRDIFYGYLPYGSEYAMYCERSDSSSVSYAMLYRRTGSKYLSAVTVSRSSPSSEWVVDDYTTTVEYSGLIVSRPYYCYSNIQGQGRYTLLPSGQNLVVLMLIVCASLAVLKFVFGGIKLWHEKSEPY